ncbi:MAG: hypothetical protein KIT84_07590 [Labilithrix sp.]|nr:hypothetical protein [Labilithrix sp.]MCW5810858.1 hypothetical protein [Labilithrix sp.]
MKRSVPLLLLVALGCRKPTETTGVDIAPAPVVSVSASASAHAPEPKPPPTGMASSSSSSSSSSASAPPVADGDARLYVRQLRTVMVDGVEETWVLRWRGKPTPSCVDKDWSTCPCWSFAYGERGDLELARMRPDEPEDVFVFRKHMEGDPELQHWIPDKDDPPGDALSLAEIKKRPVFDAMEIADYDHDGRATELAFRIGVGGACGHTSYVRLVGLTKKNPKLHLFGPALLKKEWDRIRTMDVPGSLKVIDYACGDHGTTEEESRVIHLDAAGNFKEEAKKRTCGPNE